jgi:predicted permease
MSGLITDVRYVLRVLARSPGFTLVATLSLALGMGANAAIFSTIKNLLHDPLPVGRPDELVVAHWRREVELDISQIQSSSYRDPVSGASYRTNFSYPLYRALREAAGDAQLFAFTFLRNVSIGIGGQPAQMIGGMLADGRYFSALRPGMALGRPLTDADDRPDAPLVAVLSHSFWQRTLGGDRAVIGRTIRVNGVPAEVVGVSAAGFEGLSRGGFFPLTGITLPLAAQPRLYSRWSEPGESLFTADDVFWLRVMARVPDRDRVAALTQALTAAFRAVPSPANQGTAQPAELLLAHGARGPQPVGDSTARFLWMLLGVVGAVLLIACVNLASLMLARGVAREREMAVRRALGSGRMRLVRQTLLEGLVLAALGSAAGLLLVYWGKGLVGSLLTRGLGEGAFGTLPIQPTLDPVVLGLSAALCIGATLLFGLLPALRLSTLDPASFLKHRVAGGAGPRLTLGRALIAIQIAVSVPLVVGATLLLRTVANLNAVELGFDPRGLVMFQVDPSYARVADDQQHALYNRLLERLRAIPGVRSATLLENALMSGLTSNTHVTVDGREHNLYMNAVGPDFVETMGMRLIAGRMPGPADDPARPLVGALNETAVRELFGGASPIGRVIRRGDEETLVVGVINDSRYDRQRAPLRPTLYDGALQRPGYGGHNIVLRTDLLPARLEPAIRRAVADVNPDLPVPELRTQLGQMARTTARERLFTQLLSIFGAFALLLASIGLHGVTAYSVSRRTSEIGVRVALGARPAQVLWLVLRQVAALALLGLALGIPAALAAGPLFASLVFGVAPTELTVLVTGALVMMAVAFGAGAQPALHAVRLDPLVALRTE